MFYLDLEKYDGTITTISFKENETSLGKKWAALLKSELDNGCTVAQPERLYNLNNEWSEQRVIDEINTCIDKINDYSFFIDYRIQRTTMTQEDSNALHHYFELMRGENDDPNEYYKNAPREIRDVIEEYNVLIHRWEDLGTPGRIVVHFKDRPMFPMSDEDYDCWTLDYQPGDVRINYCHKGKHLYDVYKDNDQSIGDDNITPQSRYSPDFSIRFGAGPGLNAKILNWLNTNEEKLNSLGFFLDDKKIALGQGVIGKVVGDPIDVKNQINGSIRILGVRYDSS